MEIKQFQGEPQAWNQIIASLAQPHVMQTWEWGQVKAQFGWQPGRYYWVNSNGVIHAAALVLMREIKTPGLPLTLRVQYIPKGPLLDWNDSALRQQVLKDIRELAVKHMSIFVKIDPDLTLPAEGSGGSQDDSSELGSQVIRELRNSGWQLSGEQIQFRNTIMLDLRPELDALLGNMKQKTRYNIRLAERKGVMVRRSVDDADWPLLYEMYAETANRDSFVVREKAYYLSLWRTFARAEMLDAFIAEAAGEVVAAIVVLRFGDRAWYMHGMSRSAHREKMPNYLLQWEAIRWVKARGVQFYDLWGAPDELDESDPMWGVYRFKEGLGGEFVRHIGAWDLPVRRNFYTFYTQILPRVLDVMRWRRMRETRQMVG